LQSFVEIHYSSFRKRDIGAAIAILYVRLKYWC